MSLKKPHVEIDARSNICVGVEIGSKKYRVLTEVVAGEFRLAFVFGLYEQFVVMNLAGQLYEDISRDGKKICVNQLKTAPPREWFPYVKEGVAIGFYQAGFVAGAGNGLFGLGISKAERFPDFYWKLWVTNHKIFHLQIVQDNFVIFDASYVTTVPLCKIYTGEQRVFRLTLPR